jgi:class 3 adenylate cyclase
MSGDDPNTNEATFMFPGIAGFTAFTEAHGDNDAAALVARALPVGPCRAAGRRH